MWRFVSQALVEHGANVNALNVEGHTALMHAVTMSNTTSVSTLLDCMADVNLCAPRASALTCAIVQNDQALVSTLLSRGASVADTAGIAPIHTAAQHSDITVVQQLVRSNANLHSMDETRSTPLHYAACRSDTRIGVRVYLRDVLMMCP